MEEDLKQNVDKVYIKVYLNRKERPPVTQCEFKSAYFIECQTVAVYK